jgi:hypothetical protein
VSTPATSGETALAGLGISSMVAGNGCQGPLRKSKPLRIARAAGWERRDSNPRPPAWTERFAPGPALVPCAPQAATGRGSGFVANAFVKRVAASVAGRA